jgi:hypothetical protein
MWTALSVDAHRDKLMLHGSNVDAVLEQTRLALSRLRYAFAEIVQGGTHGGAIADYHTY